MFLRIAFSTLFFQSCFIYPCIGAMQVELVGHMSLHTGLLYENTEVGGLSGISYDPGENIFYLLSDDRGFRQPARFYRFAIDFSTVDGSGLSIKIRGVIPIKNIKGETFTAGSLDPEGIAVTKDGNLFISSEGVAVKQIPPFVALYNPSGKLLEKMGVPKDFYPLPGGSRGVRDNMGFEALTLSPDGRSLTAATENAIVQDGEPATLESGSPCRLIIFDTLSRSVAAEYIYHVDPVPEAPVELGGHHLNGLVELLALGVEGDYLALERGFSEGRGHNIRLYHTTAVDREDSTGRILLSKKLVLNFDSLGIPIDNIEGMTFGPDLSDGRQSLVLVSDNNFSNLQFTQILVFAVSL